MPHNVSIKYKEARMNKYEVSIWGGMNKITLFSKSKEEAKAVYRRILHIAPDVPVDAKLIGINHDRFSDS